MPSVEIHQFATTSVEAGEALAKAGVAFTQQHPSPAYAFVGRATQDGSIVFLATQWDNSTAPSDEYTSSLVAALGQPTSAARLTLTPAESLFGPHGAMSSAVVEFAYNQFPASRATPEFREQVVADIQHFDDIFRTEAHGGQNWTAKWAEPEIDQNALFLLARGYDTMEQYEQSIKTAAFARALPTLLAWKGEHKLVCYPSAWSCANC